MAYRISLLLAVGISLAACVATDGGGHAVGDRGITNAPYESHYTYECRLRGFDPETATFRSCVEEVRLERMGRMP